MTMHGRGLGDDHPLITARPRAPAAPGTATFPENGVYICKPGLQDRRRSLRLRVGRHDPHNRARRGAGIGQVLHGVIISQPREVTWPKD